MPHGVAPADASFEPFLLHPPLFRGDEIEKRVAGDAEEAMCREHLFNLLARPAAAAYSGLVRALSSSSGEAPTSAWVSTMMSRPPGLISANQGNVRQALPVAGTSTRRNGAFLTEHQKREAIKTARPRRGAGAR